MRWAIGLMSGTSMDGVDAALLNTDGERVAEIGPFLTLPYEPAVREDLRAVLGGVGDVAGVSERVTRLHAAAVGQLLRQADMPAWRIDVVGFHGHTILHRPAQRRTWQIGDGGLLSQLVGIDVVDDFRSADVAAGGQGAPLVPVYHRARAMALEPPLAVLNVGGVANVTWIGRQDALLAFDTGPGNALIDDWMRAHTGRALDEDGRAAAGGRVHGEVVAALLRHPFFDQPPPKSLDRNDFDASLAAGLSVADGAATLAEFTARAVALGQRFLPEPPSRWLACGGGRRNPVPVAAVEAVGWQGDALEAEAFAFLAVRRLRGLPQSLPGTTGVPWPTLGGRLHRARAAA